MVVYTILNAWYWKILNSIVRKRHYLHIYIFQQSFSFVYDAELLAMYISIRLELLLFSPFMARLPPSEVTSLPCKEGGLERAFRPVPGPRVLPVPLSRLSGCEKSSLPVLIFYFVLWTWLPL